MPIVPADSNRGRAAARQRAADEQDPETGSSEVESARPARRRGVANQDENGKWQPAGDYEVGFAKPPVKHQFKADNPGGPGRPKGSRSQDSIEREKLNCKQLVTIGGRTKKVPRRELAVDIYHKKALEERDPRMLAHLIDRAGHLFPDTAADSVQRSVLGDSGLDEMVLKAFFASLAMGEANPENPDPMGSGTEIADFTGANLTGGWSEGDWTASDDRPEDRDDEAEDDGGDNGTQA